MKFFIFEFERSAVEIGSISAPNSGQVFLSDISFPERRLVIKLRVKNSRTKRNYFLPSGEVKFTAETDKSSSFLSVKMAS